jgi:sugar lactone lactonase YvrE
VSVNIVMINLDDIKETGSGLQRPECVLAHESGLLFAADWAGEGGVAVIDRQGDVRRIAARGGPRAMRPNGIALEPGGNFLLADLGAQEGGVFRLHPDGAVEPVVTELEGRAFPPTNFVYRDDDARLWITVSTRRHPRDLGYRPDVDDGFIVLFDGHGARIVADGLGYTNECHVSPDGGHLYVNETFTRRLSRFALRADGSLGPREIVAEFGAGTFPDGLTFDSEGGIWITSIVSNRVIRIHPDGHQEIVLEDADAAHLAEVEEAYQAHQLGRPHLDTCRAKRLRNISSLAFGGPDLRTAYLGCLLGSSIASFTSPVAGAPPPHWSYPLGPLADMKKTDNPGDAS